MAGLSLDTGALIAAERDEPGIWKLAKDSVEAGVVMSISAAALAEAWRGGRRSARLAQFLANCDIVALDEIIAKRVGQLLAASKTDDIADAAVMVTAALQRAKVITSDVKDLKRLIRSTPGVELVDLQDLRNDKK